MRNGEDYGFYRALFWLGGLALVYLLLWLLFGNGEVSQS